MTIVSDDFARGQRLYRRMVTWPRGDFARGQRQGIPAIGSFALVRRRIVWSRLGSFASGQRAHSRTGVTGSFATGQCR